MYYEKLAKELPKDAVEESDGKVTGKGYDTKGYKYQYIVNRLNEVVGFNWSTKQEVKLINTKKAQSGREMYEYIAKVSIVITTPATGATAGLETVRTCYGGHTSNNHGDAAKGAFTNAFKKTAALFGVGKQAYEGTIPDDDNQPPETKPYKSWG